MTLQMAGSEISTLIFDNDGTLYKTDVARLVDEIVGSMVAYISKELGMTKEEVYRERKRLFGKYDVQSTEYVFGMEYGMPYDRFVSETYLRHDLERFGIRRDNKLRRMLGEIEAPKSVLTNNPSEFARKILQTIGIEDMFEHVIGSREMEYKIKPRKEAFTKALEITGYNPLKTAFIDDVPEFHVAAKGLGMSTVLVGTGKYPHIDRTISEIYELQKALGGE